MSKENTGESRTDPGVTSHLSPKEKIKPTPHSRVIGKELEWLSGFEDPEYWTKGGYEEE